MNLYYDFIELPVKWHITKFLHTTSNIGSGKFKLQRLVIFKLYFKDLQKYTKI